MIFARRPATALGRHQDDIQLLFSKPEAMPFTVAIVGRPLALVDDQPGVTRDRREGEAKLGDLTFKAIDTAGLEDAERESLSARMQAQTAAAIAQSDAVFFLFDARAGATAE